MGKGKRNKLNKLLKKLLATKIGFFTKFDSSLNGVIDSIIGKVLGHHRQCFRTFIRFEILVLKKFFRYMVSFT